MKRSHSNAAHSRKGALFSVFAAAMSVLVIAIAIILTIGGAADVISQVLTAPSIKASVITLVLHLGLVLIGPTVLIAYVNLMPRAHLPRILEPARIGAFSTQGKAESHRH
jgi:hypothetical protein